MLVIDKHQIIAVCNESQSMSSAAAKLKMSPSTLARIATKLGCYNPNRAGKGIVKSKRADGLNKYPLSDILEGKFPQYQTSKLHIRLVREGIKEEKCEKCGITNWNDQPISLELHHKDGNCHNHRLKNLIILCPNCHSQEESHKRGGKSQV